MGGADRLKELLDRRVAVLDGSWGVLLQRRLRSEEDYRGERFRDHPVTFAAIPTCST